MKYVSTRGQAPVLPFDDVLLTGLARDGGLYVPETWPKFSKTDIKSLRGLPYGDLAIQVMTPYLGTAIDADTFAKIVSNTYAAFDHPAVAPLKQLGPNDWLLELFHGPTLAFKDYPLQLVGRLFDDVLSRKGRKVTIVGATSGDTGSAAIEACRDRDAIEIFIFHPKGRVSEVQRRQMTTVQSANVHNIALEGTFDDCQDLVKALFAHARFRDRYNLSAVNSINWARIMAQIVYYFWAALHLGAPDRKVTFSVPTGNFGNVFAGYAAHRMGLPVEKFIVGSNANDILTRYFETGEMTMAEVVPTLSPSMDIQISSNFERLLFEYYRRDGASVAKIMERFRQDRRVSFGKARWRTMGKLFEGRRLGDNNTLGALAALYHETGELVDPHTIIGIMAGRATRASASPATSAKSPVVSLATAHPAKFPDAVEGATGQRPRLPARLADLFDREERMVSLPNDIDQVKQYIAGHLTESDAT
ncbi:MAG: threonine synthase [Rhodospirillales bacterium]|nr:threonine synthase [Rhodospirillales bacterium]